MYYMCIFLRSIEVITHKIFAVRLHNFKKMLCIPATTLTIIICALYVHEKAGENQMAIIIYSLSVVS